MAAVKLDSRLETIASLVKKGSVVADIGTDHGYLPAFLVKNGISNFAFACDINSGPLENARATIKSEGLEQKVKTVLSDGLDALESDCADTVIIAGMGGLLISQILSRCVWLKNPNVSIIAQPMTHAEEVRDFFAKNGFEIEKEKCCKSAGHYYCVILASYTGKKLTYSAGYKFFGALANNRDEDSRSYLKKQLQRLKKRYNALLESGQNSDECKRLFEYISDFEKETDIEL